MGRQQEEAQHLRRPFLQQVPDDEEVAQGFGHLLLVHGHETVVQPVTGKGSVPLVGLRLGDLVLVMGEDQVAATAMDVEPESQVLDRHHRALQVPARPARSPGAVPVRLARLGSLPEHKVQRVLFALVHLYPRPGPHLFQGAPGQLAVPGELADREIDIPVEGVGHLPGQQAAHHLLHLLDVLGGLGMDVRTHHPESVCVPEVLPGVPGGQGRGIFPSSAARLMILSSMSVKFWT